jgi:NADPH-dependent curcumin reductase CurA
MKTTDGKGANVILETVGVKTLYKLLNYIRFGSLISYIGYVSNGENKPNVVRPNLNILVLWRTVTLKGVINGL